MAKRFSFYIIIQTLFEIHKGKARYGQVQHHTQSQSQYMKSRAKGEKKMKAHGAKSKSDFIFQNPNPASEKDFISLCISSLAILTETKPDKAKAKAQVIIGRYRP